MRLIDVDALAYEILETYGDVVKPAEVNEVVDDIYGMVINAPTIGGWIPCSERLPEKEGFYLVTMDGEICGVDHVFTTICGFECGEWDEGKIFAWQRLPDPYEAS